MMAHMQNTKPKFYPVRLLFTAILTTFFFTSTLAGITTQKADSLLLTADAEFTSKSYQTAADKYLQLFENGWFTKASLLKYAWIMETSGQPEEAAYALYKFYLITDDQATYTKLTELTDKYNLVGYETSEQEYILKKLRSFTWPFTGLLTSVCIFLTALMYYRKKQNPEYKTAPIGYLTFGLLVLIFITINFFPSETKAVISRTDVFFMKGPSAASGVLSPAGQGDLVEVKNEKDIWIQVSVNGKTGWIKAWQIRKV
jgi:hypothetical protein